MLLSSVLGEEGHSKLCVLAQTSMYVHADYGWETFPVCVVKPPQLTGTLPIMINKMKLKSYKEEM